VQGRARLCTADAFDMDPRNLDQGFRTFLADASSNPNPSLEVGLSATSDSPSRAGLVRARVDSAVLALKSRSSAPGRPRRASESAARQRCGLARRHLMPPRLLMRPLLNGGTLTGGDRHRVAHPEPREGRGHPRLFVSGIGLISHVCANRRRHHDRERDHPGRDGRRRLRPGDCLYGVRHRSL
jgi:hypothetical protein